MFLKYNILIYHRLTFVLWNRILSFIVFCFVFCFSNLNNGLEQVNLSARCIKWHSNNSNYCTYKSLKQEWLLAPVPIKVSEILALKYQKTSFHMIIIRVVCLLNFDSVAKYCNVTTTTDQSDSCVVLFTMVCFLVVFCLMHNVADAGCKTFLFYK